jgi:hypothetical protein
MTMRPALFILCSALLLVSGCDQTFAPKAEFQEQYVLQAFVQGDVGRAPMTMNALLAKTYDVDGFDPSVNTNDPAVDSAFVTLKTNARLDTLRERLRIKKDSLRYGSRQRYYTGRIITPSPSELVYINARLPNGRVLSAQTIIPVPRSVVSSYDFPHGVTTHANFPAGIHSWTLSWASDQDPSGHVFFPRLLILYSKTVDTLEVLGSFPVPMTLGEGNKPIYPSSTFENFCTFDFEAIDWAMAQLSDADAQKGDFGVHSMQFEVLEYDAALSKYYSSVNGSLDQFSIRIDQPIYSNVGGGIGIFGSSYDNRYTFDLDFSFVKSFGYRYR